MAIRPFVTDGMTWLWRRVSRHDPPWNDLCVEHDRVYHKGGTIEQRRQADLKPAAGVMHNSHPF